MPRLTHNFIRLLPAVWVAALLGACATTAPQIEVTRFHLNPPTPPENINIAPGATINPDSLEFQSYLQSVEAALSALGFTVVAGSDADLVANIDIRSGMQTKPRTDSPVRVGVGAGSFGGNVGMSGGVSFPLGGSGGGEIYVAELKVEMVRRSAEAVVWEGTAKRESRSAPASPAANVQALADALFANFPGQSGTTVSAD